MWEQLSGAAPGCEIREQDQHELCVQQWSGETDCVTNGVLYMMFIVTGWRETCSHPLQVEQRVHNQVCAAGAQETHAAQGEHEAQPAPWGLHLLDDEWGWKLLSWRELNTV